ncbi:PRSS27 isoform 2 [Pan troglodytes]|uniref:Serine protease 27 n=2 Tax=Homininae TaxID=207598 RepID=H3BSV0_HUMAN|nr:PRSS27 isoform 1 [Pan troglodytes]PNI91381.1 PRSS27 isoform 2 [Pan troglodytes]
MRRPAAVPLLLLLCFGSQRAKAATAPLRRPCTRSCWGQGS